jgi:tetratricopeptide (TPR) repeat protein
MVSSMLRKTLATVGLTGALLVTSSSAHADGSQAEADALFAQGRDLLEKGQFGDACVKLKKSEELAPAVGTLLNLGYCWEQVGRFRSAMESYAEAEVLAGKTGDAKRSAFAQQRLTEVQPKVMKLIILVTPPAAPDLEIKRNGVVVPKTDWGQAIAIDPDEVEVSASAPGRARWKGVVMGRGPGAVLTVFVPLLADEKEAPAPVAQPRSTIGTKRIAALGLGGAAITMIGAGIATGLYAKARYDDSLHHCDAAGCDSTGLDVQRSAVTQGNVATALVGLGALCAGAGVYLWIVGGEKATRRGSAPVQVRASVSPTGAALRGTF